MFILSICAITGTLFCWTISSVAFEYSGRRIGSINVNLLRLLVAISSFFIANLIFYRELFPSNFSIEQWRWLLLSGFLGLCLGDLCLFRAFVLIGSRLSMLIMSLSPPITIILAYFILKEKITIFNGIGIIITLLGVFLVVLERSPSNNITHHKSLWTGIPLAILGATGQSLGLIYGKMGMRTDTNSFQATEIRIIGGTLAFIVIFGISNRFPSLLKSLKDKRAVIITSIGGFVGPFLGVFFLMYTIKHIGTGLAQTFTSTIPILLIPYAIFVKHEKISKRTFLASIIAVSGVIILTLSMGN